MAFLSWHWAFVSNVSHIKYILYCVYINIRDNLIITFSFLILVSWPWVIGITFGCHFATEATKWRESNILQLQLPSSPKSQSHKSLHSTDCSFILVTSKAALIHVLYWEATGSLNTCWTFLHEHTGINSKMMFPYQWIVFVTDWILFCVPFIFLFFIFFPRQYKIKTC